MQDPELDAPADPSTATDVTPESSQEAPVETPTQQVEQKPEVPFNEHPRWQELMEERKFLREQLAAANSRSIVPQAPVQEVDPYAGMTPEEKAFFERVRGIAQKEAHGIIAEKEKIFKQELDQTKQVMATVAYERFQAKHPDVLPNSPEETAIAQLYQRGYSLDDAYKVAMFDKIQQGKVAQAQVKQKQTIQQKVAANVETSTIPVSSGLPQGKRDFRKFAEEEARKGGFI